MNYIKIELVDSLPIVELKYEDISSFQSLMFCLISESGFNLVYKTIENQLKKENKKDEMEILSMLVGLVNKEVQDLISSEVVKNTSVINPSSFK